MRDEPYENGVAGKHVIFHLEERNRVKAVDYAPLGEGTKLRVPVSKIDEMLRERNVQVTLDSFVDEATIRKVVGVLRELYAQEGYIDARVEPTTRPVAGGVKLVDLRFNILEGPRVRVREVVFDGNQAIADSSLRRRLKENKPPSKLLFWTDGGTFREEKFADDAELVTDYYKNHGYATAQVGAPQTETIETSLDGETRWIRMRVPVEEGQQYTLGNFEITDAVALRAEGIRPFFDLKEGDVFSLEKLRKGFEKVKELYGAFGYYQWTPDTSLRPRGIDLDTGKPLGPEPPPPIMDVTIKMNEGKKFYVNRITFTGNHTTHDAVIRRELRIAEGAIFNSEALKGSIRRLNQLGYFKPLEGKEGEMEVTPTSDKDDHVDVTLKVQENNKNQLAFGAGMSQYEGVFGQLSFQTSNFLGRGETVGISLQKGSQARMYRLSFSEPYVFDRPITAGFDIHSQQFIFPGSYTQESTGGNVLFGLPLADYTRLFLGYSYEQVKVLDVNPAYLLPQVLASNPFLADSLMLGQNGRRKVSKVSPSVVFNTVNQPLYPTAGTEVHHGLRLRRARRQHQLHAGAVGRHLVLPGQGADVAWSARAGPVHQALWVDADAADFREALPRRRVQHPRLRHPDRLTARHDVGRHRWRQQVAAVQRRVLHRYRTAAPAGVLRCRAGPRRRGLVRLGRAGERAGRAGSASGSRISSISRTCSRRSARFVRKSSAMSPPPRPRPAWKRASWCRS